MSGPTPESRIFVAGHRGLVGRAIVRGLEAGGYRNLVLRTRRETDLADRAAVDRLFAETRPEYAIVAAAKVGGILANSSSPADFIRENLAIALNVVDAAYRAGVAKLLFLGSASIYPRLAPQPMREEHLLTGPLEPTNQPYAVAKIAGIELCRAYNRQHGTDFVSLMPTNLYGPGDNFDLQTGHVLPALIRRVHEAKGAGTPQVTVWGTGLPRREFLHVDDLADACRFVLERVSARAGATDLLNVGVGQDLSIRELAELVREVVGYRGDIVFDTTRPDGTPRKLLDVSRLAGLGWQARIPLREGIAATYDWYKEQLCRAS
jgi:GDP-L-fucose synthase